ncbi:MAG: APC family permease [Candidatus Rokubacteria bacterium]|nr:APC family permease [Candidatus Rokubacteria bacterium]
MTGATGARLRRELGLWSLAAVVFFNVSGGPYGIEDAVPAFGPGLTLVLLVLTPLLWSLPVSLAMSELAAAMPDEGGYVTWVRRAFGPFWSFQVGWWSWIDSFVDVAVYPVLFVEYLRHWSPSIGPLERWLVVLAFITVLTALNVAGVRPTGRVAIALAIAALAPIATFVVTGAVAWSQAPWVPFTKDSETVGASLGLGLAVMMWNYSGWDVPSTCLGETRNPGRAFRAAQFLALPVIALAYVLPVGVALASGGVAWTAWETGSLPAIAASVGGSWLAHAIAAGAVLSTAGLFTALLLTNSRLPFVLARDGLMPPWLGAIASRTGAPWVAVLVSSAFYALFAVFSFKELIVLNMWLYSLTLLVELGAFLWLRLAEPGLPRPWRVPGGWPGALVVAIVPSLLSLLAMATAGWANILAGVVAALTGLGAYALVSRRHPAAAPAV